MTTRVPLVVATLPARSAEEARAQTEIARSAGADAAEIRLDRWTHGEVVHVERLFPSPLPLVATYRSRAEGGEGSDDPDERSHILRRLAALPFRWIDLELDRDLPILPSLPSPDRLARIVSVHIADGTPVEWARRMAELGAAPGVGKLIVRASVVDAYRELLPRRPPAAEGVLILHTVGPSGALLRALARRLGLPMVYGSLPEGSAGETVEPSQVPVDRLKPFLADDGAPPLFAVVGRPIEHSRSPALHARWMRSDARTGVYIPLEIATDDEFVEALPYLASSGFRGLNVTHPFKSVAFEAATSAGKGAELCRAVNCLTLRDGEVEGENTDLAAMLRRLTELRDEGRWDGRTLAVVGAGGSARATLAAARSLSAECWVYARRAEAAEALAHEFSASAGSDGVARAYPLVIHATTAGRDGAGPLGVPLQRLLSKGSHVIDWVYDATDPSVRQAAVSSGATFEDGWRLLVYQAAESYALWWGNDPAPESVTAALAEGGCAG